MEYVFVNDWFIYWFAILTLSIYTIAACMLLTAAVFVATIVYDIFKQVTLKWKMK